MVQAFTLFLAAFAIAPVLALPLTTKQADESFTRSFDDGTELDIRDPRFRFNLKKIVRGATRIVKTAAKFVPPIGPLGLIPVAANLVLRDVEGNVYVRDLDESELSLYERDLIDMEELDTREPWSFGNWIRGATRKVSNTVKDVGKVVNTAVNVEKAIGLREFDEEEFEAREIDELD